MILGAHNWILIVTFCFLPGENFHRTLILPPCLTDKGTETVPPKWVTERQEL